MFPRRNLMIVLGAALAAGACGPTYVERIAPLEGPELYRAAMAEYAAERWSNAIAALERLSRELPARDTLLPRVYYHLGDAHSRRDEHLLAAQSFQRIMETFPNDTLADDGLLRAGQEYAAMWRKPALDPEYGHTALSTFQTLLAVYPNADVRDQAEREMRELVEQLARKDYETGLYYTRRGGLESAILYFEGVVSRYPETEVARLARLRMLEIYRRREWTAEIRETCDALRAAYPNDAEVREACGPVPPPPVVP